MKQATEEELDYTESGVPFVVREFVPKKFAELIVRECAQKLENDGMVEVAMEIKQHFGVE